MTTQKKKKKNKALDFVPFLISYKSFICFQKPFILQRSQVISFYNISSLLVPLKDNKTLYNLLFLKKTIFFLRFNENPKFQQANYVHVKGFLYEIMVFAGECSLQMLVWSCDSSMWAVHQSVFNKHGSFLSIQSWKRYSGDDHNFVFKKKCLPFFFLSFFFLGDLARVSGILSTSKKKIQ